MNHTKEVLLILLLCVFTTVTAAAHDGHKHGGKMVMGTVQSVNQNQMKVKMKDGETMIFVIEEKTKIVQMMGKKPGAREDLKPGSRVAVKFDASATPFKALEVKVAGTAHDNHAHKEGMKHNH